MSRRGSIAKVGQELGGCRLERLLGRGGVSATYLAQHQRLGLPVVVKVLDPQRCAGQPALAAGFLQEGRSLARVQHPAVVRVHHAGEEQGLPFLVLEYVRGTTLRAVIREGRLSLDRTVQLLAAAGEGLGAVHAMRLVHRDVKPDNLMVTAEDEVKVVDFGLTLQHGASEGDAARVTGTPAYMAPEQCRRRPLDARADVYALGVTLYECLCDRWPFNAPEPRLLLRKHVQDEPPLEPLEAAKVPRPFIELVSRCLAKSPDERPADGAAFAEALRQAHAPAPRIARRKRRGRPGKSSASSRTLNARRSSGNQRTLSARRSSGNQRALPARRTSGSFTARSRGSGAGLPVLMALAFGTAIALGLLWFLRGAGS